MTYAFAGVDIETTGTDPNKNHRIIQIGVVLPGDTHIVYDVRPEGDVVYQTEAMEVNKFTPERIAAAQPTADVDNIVYDFIRRRGYGKSRLIPVGYNVSGFDMTFIRKEMPRTASLFSYRTVDLTAIAMLCAQSLGCEYGDIKSKINPLIEERLQGRDNWHDALYDAEAALVAFDIFKTHVQWTDFNAGRP